MIDQMKLPNTLEETQSLMATLCPSEKKEPFYNSLSLSPKKYSNTNPSKEILLKSNDITHTNKRRRMRNKRKKKAKRIEKLCALGKHYTTFVIG